MWPFLDDKNMGSLPGTLAIACSPSMCAQGLIATAANPVVTPKTGTTSGGIIKKTGGKATKV